jgi:esterase/lipase
MKISGLEAEEKKLSERVAIISPGFRATKNEGYLLKIKKEIEKKRISTIIFTFRIKKITVESELEDLNKIVKYAEKYEKIALVGHSFGGVISMLYAAKNQKNSKIKALILLSAPVEFESKRRKKWIQKLKSELKQEKTMNEIKKIKTPTLIIQGVFDERIPKNSENILKKSIKNSVMKKFKTDHFYTNKRELKKISVETAKWVVKKLR